MSGPDSNREPARCIQPCSEGCVFFRALPNRGWSDYGVCTNPRSPFHAYPALIRLECPHYRTDPAPPAPEAMPVNPRF